MSDVDNFDARAHQLKITTTVCRYVAAVIVAVAALTAWRCEPNEQLNNNKEYWHGKANGCLDACD